MDFAAIPRPAFGRHAQHAEDKAPGVHHAKATARRAMMFKEAKELLSALPGPGEAVHAIMTGRYDLMLLLVALLDLHPTPCRRLRIATLCFNRRNAVEMLGLLESGKIGGLTLLASSFFKANNKELFESFRDDLADFPTSRIAAAQFTLQGGLFRLRRRDRAGVGGVEQPPDQLQSRTDGADERPRPARLPRRMAGPDGKRPCRSQRKLR